MILHHLPSFLMDLAMELVQKTIPGRKPSETDERQLNKTLSPGFQKASGSRNDSFSNISSSKNNSLPHTSWPNEKQLNSTSTPGFRKESSSRNDSFGKWK
ncbi:hypothetical protein OIU85_029006 [Salix viminalis]|uniref:Uncharacterized protein n=1 Tax=Salix viminalis TaxID=40686 RepID=A0A9Q0QBB1_SALVM|nr:hypothetical protein OIU85_029006 [Salix viminalis]